MKIIRHKTMSDNSLKNNPHCLAIKEAYNSLSLFPDGLLSPASERLRIGLINAERYLADVLLDNVRLQTIIGQQQRKFKDIKLLLEKK